MRIWKTLKKFFLANGVLWLRPCIISHFYDEILKFLWCTCDELECAYFLADIKFDRERKIGRNFHLLWYLRGGGEKNIFHELLRRNLTNVSFAKSLFIMLNFDVLILWVLESILWKSETKKFAINSCSHLIS